MLKVLLELGIHRTSQVVLVRHKDTRKVFALKAMGKKQVIAQHELDHALVRSFRPYEASQ